MRLLRLEHNGEFSLTEYVGKNVPPYAILSHTWGADHEEVIFRDLIEGTGKSKAGYCKLTFCAKRAAHDGLQFFWVDTCCIDKSSSAELSEAINSMFQWYYMADKCYVYLSDVAIGSCVSKQPSSQRTWKLAFRRSKWFTRGWTLQELIAPLSVEFFSAEGERLGEKKTMLREIHDITGISVRALEGSHLSEFSIDDRMAWAEGRETKREEDTAYSLLGIFNIHIPLLYGEGRKKAFGRLRKEIQESLKDEWHTLPLALSPQQAKLEHITDLLMETRISSVPTSFLSTPTLSREVSDISCITSSQKTTTSSISSSQSISRLVSQNAPQPNMISGHPLLQFKDNQFQFLIATIFTKRTTKQHLACQRASECLAIYPTPEALSKALPEVLSQYFGGIGLQTIKPPQLIKLAQAYVNDPPKHGRLRSKPKCPQSEVSHLPQIGTLSVNAWLVYCCERTNIVTKDKTLLEYVEYLKTKAKTNSI